MSVLDRVVRRTATDLGPYEGLVASVLGVEDRDGQPGRRRIAVIATDQRLLLVPVRGGVPTAIPWGDLGAVHVESLDTGPRLDLVVGEVTHHLHGVDPGRLDLFATLVRGRRPAAPPRSGPGVRLVS